MSNNLGRNEVQAAQNQKEVTINESDGILDAKLTEDLTADFTSGDVTLTAVQFQQNAAVLCTNVSVARVLNTPQNKGSLIVDNRAGTAIVTITRGTGTVEVPAGEVRVVYQDGTANSVFNVGGGGGGTALTDYKDSVVVATTANITLSGEQTIDGVLTSSSRVLVKDQTTGSENGIYVSAAGAWSRSSDFDEDAEVTAGVIIPVTEGTANADNLFILTTNDPIVVGTTSLTFSTFSAASTIAVQDDGVGVVASASTVNFTGAGVTVTDSGGGVAAVNIPGGGGAATWPTVNLTGTTETLLPAHALSGVILTNASAITLTVENNATQNIPVGNWVRIIQGGAGVVTVAAGSGVTINSQGTALSLNGQFAGAVLWHYATDTWLLEGNLT